MCKSVYKRLICQIPEFRKLHDKLISTENDLYKILDSISNYRSACVAYKQCTQILLDDDVTIKKAKILLEKVEITRNVMLDLSKKIRGGRNKNGK
jgi:hypothetical protein